MQIANWQKSSRIIGDMARYRMRQRRFAEIADLADEVAEYYFPDAWIDPEEIIRDAGITLSFNDYGNAFDGMLEWTPRGFHIYCNLGRVENCTSGRARFTLGHELGHYFINEHRTALESGAAPSHPSFCCDSEPDLAVEQEANLFASHLLMPDSRMDKVLSPTRGSASVADIERLKTEFKVSFQSAARRVICSTRAPCCAGVMWRPNGKHWYVVSPAFIAEGYQFMLRRQDDLPPDCATRLRAEDENAGGELYEGTTVASYWFTRVLPGTARDIILHEEAVRLGPYGVFTFLAPRESRQPIQQQSGTKSFGEKAKV